MPRTVVKQNIVLCTAFNCILKCPLFHELKRVPLFLKALTVKNCYTMLDENYRVTHYRVGGLIEKGQCMIRFKAQTVFLYPLAKYVSICVSLLLIVLCILFMNNKQHMIAE